MRQLFVLFLVAVTVQAHASTSITVKGKTVDRMGNNPLNMRMGSQTFTVKYPDTATASKAKLKKLPIYDGKKWAFSSRWDDNNKANIQMRDLMKKYGYKGSFYLYSHNRNKWSKKMKTHAKDISKYGFTVGAHSITHPKLPSLDKNKMFKEVSAIRLELEASTNQPVISFAFPYGQYKSKKDPSIHRDIGEALFRTGYHHNTYSQFAKKSAGVSPKAVSSVTNVRPGDRKTSVANFDKGIAFAERKTWFNKHYPCLTLATHVWLKGKDWDAMEAGLKKYANRPDWWYCNQNEYAAYRYQYFHSTLKKIKQTGSSVTYQLTTPIPQDLGAKVPLSVAAPGAISSAGGVLTKVNGQTLVNVSLPDKYKLPAEIDAVMNQDNTLVAMSGDKSRSLPKLNMQLSYDKKSNELILKATNKSSKSLTGIQARLGLPLAFPADDNWNNLGKIKAGGSAEYKFKLPKLVKEEKFLKGDQFFFVQLDSNLGNTPVRIYAATESKVQ